MLMLPLVKHSDPSIVTQVFDIYKHLSGIEQFAKQMNIKDQLVLIQAINRMPNLGQIDSHALWAICKAFNPQPVEPLIRYTRQEPQPLKNVVIKIYKLRDWVL
ncbi:hypothetical protein WDU94_007438 [Cyamophila willieti]